MTEKYVKLADVKRKVNYILTRNSCSPQTQKAVKDTINNLPYVVEAEIETTLEAADVQPVNRWISVDDRLPEDVKIVLVWYTSNTLFGLSEGYGLSWYSPSIGWRKDELNGDNIAIRHWQPLPEPPKEG